MNLPEGLEIPSEVLSSMGYDKTEYANFVCKLNKALYGLKQASRCWYETFVHFLSVYNFKVCESDKSLYVGYVNNEKVYITGIFNVTKYFVTLCYNPVLN